MFLSSKARKEAAAQVQWIWGKYVVHSRKWRLDYEYHLQRSSESTPDDDEYWRRVARITRRKLARRLKGRFVLTRPFKDLDENGHSRVNYIIIIS